MSNRKAMKYASERNCMPEDAPTPRAVPRNSDLATQHGLQLREERLQSLEVADSTFWILSGILGSELSILTFFDHPKISNQ